MANIDKIKKSILKKITVNQAEELGIKLLADVAVHHYRITNGVDCYTDALAALIRTHLKDAIAEAESGK